MLPSAILNFLHPLICLLQHLPVLQGEDGISGDEAEGDLEDDPDQAKLWEEVDKGLTALQGLLVFCMSYLSGWLVGGSHAGVCDSAKKLEVSPIYKWR